MDAQRVMLRIAGRPGSVPQNVLMPADDSEAIYLAYYHLLNPYFAQARRDFAEARSRHLATVKLGPELVRERSFLRSEYYSDFARHHERRHLLAGMVGVGDVAPVGLFRAEGAGPFGARERRLLRRCCRTCNARWNCARASVRTSRPAGQRGRRSIRCRSVSRSWMPDCVSTS
jgi:hypothetical protein